MTPPKKGLRKVTKYTSQKNIDQVLGLKKGTASKVIAMHMEDCITILEEGRHCQFPGICILGSKPRKERVVYSPATGLKSIKPAGLTIKFVKRIWRK